MKKLKSIDIPPTLFTYAIISVVVIVLLVAIMRRVGLIRTKDQKQTDKEKREAKQEKKNIEKILTKSELFNPNTYLEFPDQYLLNESQVEDRAKQLKGAMGFFNDDESEIYAVFRSLNDKAQVSQLAAKYYELYQKDLLGDLDDHLNKDELVTVYNIIKAI